MRLIKYILVIGLCCCFVGCGNKKKQGEFRYFTNYQRTFNDLNSRHLKAAREWGVVPAKSDEQLEGLIRKMTKITSCRYYEVDELTHSLPYLVPRAEELLEVIGRNFRDSLDSRGLSSAKIVVTSVFRTSRTVKQLRKRNTNASANSAHVYGTTFDIAYARFKGGDREDAEKMKSVLAEVLRDLRKAQRCYVRYEFKQGCFHITVR